MKFRGAFRDLKHSIRVRVVPILLDIYCDSLTLAQSRTQSISLYRVRFSSVKAFFDIWHEIGTASSVQAHNIAYTEDTL